MWLTNNKTVSIRQTSPVKSAHFQIQLLGRFEYSTTDINNLAIAVFVENPISIAISLTLYNNRIRYFRGFVNRPRFVFICVFLHAGLEKTVIIVFFFRDWQHNTVLFERANFGQNEFDKSPSHKLIRYSSNIAAVFFQYVLGVRKSEITSL